MHVTIYTDGGLSHTKGQAYAYYCRSNRGVLKAAVYIKHHFDNPNQVEAYAAHKAIETTIKHWPEVSFIILNTDNTAVIHFIEKPWKSGKDFRFMKIIRSIQSMKDTGKIKLKCKHVKGHTGAEDVRSYLNDWCDKELNKVRQYFNKKG